MSRILEAGHYYSNKGPTINSILGWKILEQIMEEGDKSMLFIDDLHLSKDLHPEEEKLEVVANFDPEYDYLVLESATREKAIEILRELTLLSSRKRAKKKKGGKWFVSGFPVTDEEEEPLCVLLDAGLTMMKKELGYSEGINILPSYYRGQQLKLMKIVRKAIPEFNLRVFLFDNQGEYQELKLG
ncbi:hypothetical protein K8R66_04315 [bacterium]|nr:hypothetical protein [bacterium]